LQLNTALEARTIKDIDSFDEILLEILQSDAIRDEMETMRDSMLQYLFQQIDASGGKK
jgi:CRISPR/Cas system-associated endonuclease/helicase Cas3